jgi:hypothetical protein
MLLVAVEIIETREANFMGACHECLAGRRQGLYRRLANRKWAGASVPSFFSARRVFQSFEGFEHFFK